MEQKTQLSHRYEIDPRQYRKDYLFTAFIMVFSSIWLVGGFFATYNLLQGFELSSAILLLAGCVVLLVVAPMLFASNCKQSILIEEEMVVVQEGKTFSRMHKSWLKAVTLERYHRDSFYSLNLVFDKALSNKDRISLGQFIAPTDKAKIFVHLCDFLRNHNITFIERNELSANEKEPNGNL